jgi:hypothetical protein
MHEQTLHLTLECISVPARQIIDLFNQIFQVEQIKASLGKKGGLLFGPLHKIDFVE